MNLSQKYKVERIIGEIVTANKDKTLEELKKMIKIRIRQEINPEVASQVGIEKIIEVVTRDALLRTNREPKKYRAYYKAYDNKAEIVKDGRDDNEL